MALIRTKQGSVSLSIEAALDTMPLAIAVVPWGILTGALAIQIGLSAMQAQLMSLLVFAGAAQLSGMTLMAGGASSLALFGSTFVISARHLLYSIVFREHVIELPQAWRIAIAMVLTDEMFAVSQAHTLRSGDFSPIFALVSGITFYLIWNIATLVGIIAGDSFDNLESLGLDLPLLQHSLP
jgi:predicted branched-subunit amino acid permease